MGHLLVFYLLREIFLFRAPFSVGKHPLLPESGLISALRPNLLLVFLLCNLLTGVLNLSLDTINQSAPASVAIIALYMLGLCLVAFGLHTRGIKLKFW